MMVMMISLFGGIFGTSDLRGYGGGGQFRVFRCFAVAGLLPSQRNRKKGQTNAQKKTFRAEKSFFVLHGLKLSTDQAPRIKRFYCCAVVAPGPWFLALHCPAGHREHAHAPCREPSVAKPHRVDICVSLLPVISDLFVSGSYFFSYPGYACTGQSPLCGMYLISVS